MFKKLDNFIILNPENLVSLTEEDLNKIPNNDRWEISEREFLGEDEDIKANLLVLKGKSLNTQVSKYSHVEGYVIELSNYEFAFYYICEKLEWITSENIEGAIRSIERN